MPKAQATFRCGRHLADKWFGRYIREIGITDSADVFHLFRHNFKNAL
jgi:hypothetical protein